jgi:hypothetical protein
MHDKAKKRMTRKDFGSKRSAPQQTGIDHCLGAARAARLLVSELNSRQNRNSTREGALNFMD